MKKLLFYLIFIFATSVNSFAQTFTTYVDPAQSNGLGFGYSITIRLTLLRMAAGPTLKSAGNSTEYSVELVRVDVDKNKGWYQSGKVYNCAKLEGICNTKNFSSINLSLTYNCGGRETGSNTWTFYNVGEKQIMELQTKSGCSSPTASGIGGISINNNENASIISSIIQKLNKGDGKTTATAGNISNNNPATAETKSANDPVTENDNTASSGNSNPMTTTTKSDLEKGYETGQQIADAVLPIAQSWVDAHNKRVEARDAEFLRERSVREASEKEINLKKFEAIYLPLMDEAIKGDEDARMILYYATLHLQCTEKYPQREKWFNEAVENNNLDALVEKVYTNVYTNPVTPEEGMYYLEKAAGLGSSDAMVLLGNFYDLKLKKYGGKNPAKAIEWYTKAAENGSPSAMYYLGMIYKYNRRDIGPGKKTGVKYNIPIDEKKAFEWFSKSIIPDYKPSIFQREYCFGSQFIPDSYMQLGYLYKEGKGVEKDEEKAKEFFLRNKEHRSGSCGFR